VEDPLYTGSDEDRLNHIADKDGVEDLAAMWLPPSPSTSKRAVQPVSFSISLSYILYLIYLTYHAIYFACYLINFVLFDYPVNPVSSTKYRVDPAEVNRGNSPQSDESIIRSSAVLPEPRTEEVSLDASSGKRKERGEKNDSTDIEEDSSEEKEDSCIEPSSKTRKIIDDNTFKNESADKIVQ
jgi:hypothetical protein